MCTLKLRATLICVCTMWGFTIYYARGPAVLSGRPLRRTLAPSEARTHKDVHSNTHSHTYPCVCVCPRAKV